MSIIRGRREEEIRKRKESKRLLYVYILEVKGKVYFNEEGF